MILTTIQSFSNSELFTGNSLFIEEIIIFFLINYSFFPLILDNNVGEGPPRAQTLRKRLRLRLIEIHPANPFNIPSDRIPTNKLVKHEF